ncbi:MAG: hypothetical protein OEX22_02535 [Cyclobacteriaceae bacterium]|nr:hypothetical protein [Cyclobacteriaceae bacterium]
MKKNVKTIAIVILLALPFMPGCDVEAPPIENEEEVIDLVRLTFTPSVGDAIVFEAKDMDGAGAEDFTIPKIVLSNNTTYSLSIEVENAQTAEDITTEISAEAEDHLFLFEWTEGIFLDPLGNGNVDNRDDTVVYTDSDVNQLPLGLSTSWSTGDPYLAAQFRFVLKHQPSIKSASSTIDDGVTDIDLSWVLDIM